MAIFNRLIVSLTWAYYTSLTHHGIDCRWTTWYFSFCRFLYYSAIKFNYQPFTCSPLEVFYPFQSTGSTCRLNGWDVAAILAIMASWGCAWLPPSPPLQSSHDGTVYSARLYIIKCNFHYAIHGTVFSLSFTFVDRKVQSHLFESGCGTHTRINHVWKEGGESHKHTTHLRVISPVLFFLFLEKIFMSP